VDGIGVGSNLFAGFGVGVLEAYSFSTAVGEGNDLKIGDYDRFRGTLWRDLTF
jgi:hypothetical protein